ncbi:MAG: PqqD family protein [Rhodothermales bacterium]
MAYYELGSDQIAREQFDNETVIIDLETGLYFAVSDSGTMILNSLLDGKDIDELQSAIHNNELITSDMINSFISSLVEHKILRELEHSPTANTSSNEEFNLGDCQEIPTVEVYKDLADLVMADPIHEVDENVGWPQKKV